LVTLRKDGYDKRSSYLTDSQTRTKISLREYLFVIPLAILFLISFFASFALIIEIIELMRLGKPYAALLLLPVIALYVLSGLIFASEKAVIRNILGRRSVIKTIGGIVAMLMIVGTVPIAHLTSLPSFMLTLISFLLVMAGNILSLLILFFGIAHISHKVSIRTFFGQSFIGFAKITYLSGSDTKKFTISPAILNIFALDMREDFIQESRAYQDTTVRGRISGYTIGRKEGECNLSLKMTITIGGKDHSVYEYLDNVNVYINGELSSIVTFHEPEKLRQISIPLIKGAENTIFIHAPTVKSIPTGRHTITLEFTSPSGRKLCTYEEELSVPEWIQEGESWDAIPVEILSSRFGWLGMEEYVYVKCEETKEGAPIPAEREDKIKVSFSSVHVDLIKGGSDGCTVEGLKICLEAFDTFHLKIIKAIIDDEYIIDIIFKQPLLLSKKHLYTFKIPHLPVLNVTAGTHTLMITLLEGNLGGECQEILTYVSEFTCIAKKPKLKMTTRRRGKNVKRT